MGDVTANKVHPTITAMRAADNMLRTVNKARKGEHERFFWCKP
ncbi:hypothetical protein BFV94_1612 [Alteromonas macleodii]|uniref:Cyclic pyranopterin monophosphate synthase n=1 Tax=Alteromonas macleodii TaxID=28108 RepID=A0AB36FW54_ALTMA|nr:hypothetical protein BFV95_1611 [Alteromonas macleodii]OES35606.1 hypothetical protein BFV94_1612 [Alteromonas macleodii]OES37196.1 hypothetical protein BFV93_1608 [Alteromonas macleodii]OES41541.1 hypothetical protein BFV96_1611 [Alteromonas macleodii]